MKNPNLTIYDQPLYRGQEVMFNTQATKEPPFYAIICDDYKHGLWNGILILSGNSDKTKIIKWAVSRVHPMVSLS